MGTAEVSAIIAGCILGLQFILSIIDRVHRNNKFQQTINDAIAKSKLELVRELADMSNEIRDASEKTRIEMRNEHNEFTRQFSDSLPAIRQKIIDVEIWSRDEFIRRDEFNRVIDAVTSNIQNLGDKIEAKIDALENRYFKKT